VPLFTVDVRLTERIGVQAAASVPDVTRTAVVQRAAGPVNFRETFRGMGDMSLLMWYRARPGGVDVIFNAGTSLPTGRTEQPRFRAETEDGSLVPMSRLQRGSGTVDPLFGMNISHRVARVTLFSSLAARTPLYENDFGLRTGSAWEGQRRRRARAGHAPARRFRASRMAASQSGRLPRDARAGRRR